MTATTQTRLPRVPGGRYGLAQAARMEWIKLRSLRSTWWTLAVTAAGTIGIGIAVGLGTRNGSGDLTNNALAGVVPSPWAVARMAVTAPFTRREGRELLFCLTGLPFAIVVNPLALFILAVDLTWLVTGSQPGNPSPADLRRPPMPSCRRTAVCRAIFVR